MTGCTLRKSFGLAVLLAFAQGSIAGDFAHWRGPTRDDHVAEDSGFDTKAWPLKKPLWESEVGEGATSPVVVDGKVHVLGWNHDQDTLQSLDATTGKPLWKQSYPARKYGRHATGDEGLYSGPTATPEYDAATKFLYTLGSDGELRCWNLAKAGEVVWRKNVYDEYKMPQRPKIKRSGLRDYGYTMSPLVYGDWLLVEAGGERGTVVALDKQTGKPLWGSEHHGLAGHSGGLVAMTVENVPCVALLTLRELLVLRVDKANAGKTVATFPWESEWANNLLTPTVVGDGLLVGSYHTHHSIARIKITLQGAEKLWEVTQASYVGSPVVDGERIYFAGTALYCLDAGSGKLLWEGGRFDNGASLLFTQDERLIALGSNGTIALVETCRRSPAKYKELARNEREFPADAWCHVVVADGRLYGKDRNGVLKCWGLGAGNLETRPKN